MKDDKTSELLRELLQREADALEKQLDGPVIGDFLKFAFPLVRQSFPQLVAQQLVSVQPMSSPISSIFYKQPPPKTPLLELTERVWADEDETDAPAQEHEADGQPEDR